jgi:hypothetical protein
MDHLHDDYFDMSLDLSDKNSGFKWYSKLLFGHLFFHSKYKYWEESSPKKVFYARMILGAKFRSWANFPWFFQK